MRNDGLSRSKEMDRKEQKSSRSMAEIGAIALGDKRKG